MLSKAVFWTLITMSFYIVVMIKILKPILREYRLVIWHEYMPWIGIHLGMVTILVFGICYYLVVPLFSGKPGYKLSRVAPKFRSGRLD